MSTAIIPILTIVEAALPELPVLIQDVKNLFAKYPTMTQAQIASVVMAVSTQSDTEFADALATIKAALPPASSVAPAVKVGP